MKKLFFAATLLLFAAGCSKTQSGDGPAQYTGEKFPIDFSPSVTTKAPDGGYGNLPLGTKVSMSVFKASQAAADFIDVRYRVADKDGPLGLSYDNTVTPPSDKQKIIELTVGNYDIYAAAINDGGKESIALNPLDGAAENTATYLAHHGIEYIWASKTGHAITETASTRQVRLSFARQVAKLSFTFVAGSGLTLPATMTQGLVTNPRITLPTANPDNAAEGVFNLCRGIDTPLTGPVDTDYESMLPNAPGSAVGIHMFVLPSDLGASSATYKVRFTMNLNDGSGTAANRVLNLDNIPMPTNDSGNSVFEKGKQYNYTVTINNTGLYISEVQVADWTTSDQGGLTAE